MVKRLMAILMSAMMLITMLPTNTVATYAATADECQHILTAEDIANIPDEFWQSHSHDDYYEGSSSFISVEVPAGCTEDGWYIEKTDSTGFCIVCGEIITEGDKQPLPATGHNYEVIKEATCTEDGIKECQNTNYKLVVEKINGLYSASLQEVDCDAKEVTIPAFGHTWKKDVVTVDPTCTEDGSKTTTRICETCGEVQEKTEVIPKLGHDYEKTVIQEATCDNEGTNLYTCTRCGDTYTEIIPKLEHTGLTTTLEPTCIDYGKREGYCDLCGRYIVEAIEPLGHDFDTEVIAPTCTEDGYTLFTCKRCGYQYKGDYVLAIGHDYDYDNPVITEPTCTETGLTTYICKNDSSHTISEEIPALGHKFAITEHVEPTCTETGRNVYTCERCGNAYIERIPELGHDVEVIETIEPNCVHGTIEIGVCKRCDKAIVTEADDIDHSITFASGLGYAGAYGFFVEPVMGEEDTYYLRSAMPLADMALNFAAVLANPDLFTAFIRSTGHDFSNYDGETPYVTDYVPATCDHDAYWTITCSREEEVPVAGTYDSIDDIDTETRTCPYPEGDGAVGHQIKIINANSAYGHLWELLDDKNSKAPTCGEDGYRRWMCLNDHAHTYTEKLPATGEHKYATEHIAATCTEPGKDVYTCTVCGDTYEVTTTAAKGHNYAVSGTVAATCTTEGYDVYTCTECGDTYNKTTTPAKGHSYVVTDKIAATCDKEGYEVYTCKECGDAYNKITTPAKGHQFTETNYVAPTCAEKGVRTYTCVDCDKTYNSYEPALGHNYGKSTVVKATCTDEGYTVYECTNPNCTESYKTEITDKVPHVLSVVDQKAPTCAEDGYETRGCANCDYTETKVLPATGNHVYSNAVTKAATCTEDGVMTYTCKECGTQYTEVIPAIGHNYGDVKVVEATCTADGYTLYTCTNPGCTESYKTEITDKVPHVLSVVDQKAPTCAEDGYETRGCANCDYTETKVLPATGNHVYSNAVTKAATCTEDGVMTYTCKECGTQYTEVISAIGHNYGDVKVVEATCTADGYTLYTCTNPGCTVSYKTEITDKVEHVLSVVDQKDPTCTENGYVKRACANCEYTESEMLPATGHIFDTEGVNTPATCEKEGYTTYTCAVCGEKQVIKTAEKLGHVYKTVVSKTAKVGKDGIQTEVCVHCGKEIVVNKIDAIKSVSLAEKVFAYNKKARKPAVIVKDSKGKTISSKYYTVAYANNKNIGTATATITFKGLYSGKVVKKFKIVPKGVGISKTYTTKNTIRYTWGRVKNCDGYKIQYSTSKNFKNAKKITIKGRKTCETYLNNLKSGKKYYIRVRAYKKVDGKNYYGEYSKCSRVCK